MANKIDIFGRLHAQTEEGILTAASEIFDEDLNKTQSEINSEMISTSDLSQVAISGDYQDLINKPSVPNISLEDDTLVIN